jgi:hypothetical protein
MKAVAIVGCFAVGGLTGYGLARLTATPAGPVHGLATQGGVTAAIAMTDTQLDALAERLAPAIARRFGTSARTPNPAQTTATEAANKEARDAAFARAAQMVDRMIAARSITGQGLNEAHALLRETGQADRGYELQARISATMNRGELTLDQAGLGQ